MPDVVDAATRSRMMAGIRGKNTKPEILLRRALTSLGYRYRLHRKDLPGAPDIAMPGRRIAIFAHGCFWHMHEGCRYAKLPSTRPEFWSAKLQGNVARDARALAELRSMGWRTLVVWECATRGANALPSLARELSAWVEGADAQGEIGGPREG
jgi:DNA mismatch endonuclease (patch repair protein)